MSHQVILQPNEQLVREFSISQRLVSFLIVGGIALLIICPLIVLGLASLIGLDLTGAVFGLAGLVGLILGAAVVAYAFYFRLARHYILTNERVLATAGWVSQNTDSVNYEFITNIDVEQDIFERLILRTGLVKIESASAAVDVVRLERVDQPYQVAATIRELAEERIKVLGGTPRSVVNNAGMTTPLPAGQPASVGADIQRQPEPPSQL